MAGVADWAFREVCYQFGVEIAVSPLISADGLVLSPKSLLPTIGGAHGERTFLVQLFGHEPESFRQAARIVSEALPVSGIDVNMGCPAHTVVSSNNGSALLREPERAAEVVAATRAGTNLPVSVKLRIGWDSVTAPELVPLLEAAGVQAIAVHGRTREQQYKGPVDLAAIRAVKRAARVPVVGNGNVNSVDSAIAMLEATGVDGVMVGRSAMGNPWLFAELQAALKENRDYLDAWPHQAELIRHHARLAFASEGDQAALTIRKHLMAYTRGHPHSSRLRRMVERLYSWADVEAWIQAFNGASPVLSGESALSDPAV